MFHGEGGIFRSSFLKETSCPPKIFSVQVRELRFVKNILLLEPCPPQVRRTQIVEIILLFFSVKLLLRY